MTAKQTNVEQIYNAHYQALVNMVSDRQRTIVNQIPLFMMTEEEIDEFENFVINSESFEIANTLRLQ